MSQEAYINGYNSIHDKISSSSEIFLSMNSTSQKMDKVTSSANLLEKVLRLQTRTHPNYLDSKTLAIPMSLGWKRDNDPDAVDIFVICYCDNNNLHILILYQVI